MSERLAGSKKTAKSKMLVAEKISQQGSWKLIFRRRRRKELFNLLEGPREKNNRAEKHPERILLFIVKLGKLAGNDR